MDSIVLPLVSAIQISQGSFAPTPPGKRHCEPPWGVCPSVKWTANPNKEIVRHVLRSLGLFLRSLSAPRRSARAARGLDGLDHFF
jgi:hypothetical protein